MEMDAAKRLLAPDRPLETWHANGADGHPKVQLEADGAAVTVSSATASNRFRDNVPRVAVSALNDDGSGDSLPHTPVVLTGCCAQWPAWRGGSGESWSAERLASRLPAATRVRLDGGPAFARESLCNPFVTLQAYAQYCSSTQDSASLYVFDDKVLTAPFGGGGDASAVDFAGLVARAHARRRGRTIPSPGPAPGAAPSSAPGSGGGAALDAEAELRLPRSLSEEYTTPRCFSRCVQARLRRPGECPLPPAWLLVGAALSGTPIHDHPTTVAWNALFVGCKLWCCLPADVDETVIAPCRKGAGSLSSSRRSRPSPLPQPQPQPQPAAAASATAAAAAVANFGRQARHGATHQRQRSAQGCLRLRIASANEPPVPRSYLQHSRPAVPNPCST